MEIRVHPWLPPPLPACCSSALPSAEEKVPKIALVTTVWYQNSHADVIAGRLLDGYTLDGKGEFPKLKLVSAYVDQFAPRGDKSRDFAKKHGFTIYDSIEKALTLGGDKLAVDGVLMVAEHGEYPESEFGSIQHPKRRFFGEIVKVFDASGRVVPVFSDKHLADNWTDIAWIYGESQRLKIPLMAGSSLPGMWRYPPVDTERDKPIKEIVATSYHRLDAYGFHALEMAQCLAERRKNGEVSGETGVKRVRTISGDAVWAAGDAGEFDLKLLDEVVTRFKDRPLPAGKTVREVVKEPILFMIDYNDGLRTSILTMDGSNVAFAAGWRYADGSTGSDRLLDAGIPPIPALHVPAQRGRADVSHRPADLAGRADAPDQRPARFAAHQPQTEGGMDRDARIWRRSSTRTPSTGSSRRPRRRTGRMMDSESILQLIGHWCFVIGHF